jgi:hypothetical protein
MDHITDPSVKQNAKNSIHIMEDVAKFITLKNKTSFQIALRASFVERHVKNC